MRARWYETQSATFINHPALTSTNAPYSSANGDPVNNSDPSGMCGSSNACWQLNNSWMNAANSSPTGQVMVTRGEAYHYLRMNGWRRRSAIQGIRSFNWNSAVTMTTMPGNVSTLKYANSGSYAGRRFWTTPQVFSSPSVAVTALYLRRYGNHATYAWMILENGDQPVLYGYVAHGWGLQFLNASADTNSSQLFAHRTQNVWSFFTQDGFTPVTLGIPNGPPAPTSLDSCTSSGSGYSVT